MKLKIQRFKESKEEAYIEEFSASSNQTVLNTLIEVKMKHDKALSFRCGCRTGVCGSCAVKVNGVEKLACKTLIRENDLIEPLNNAKVIKDLIVSLSHEEIFLKNTKTFLKELNKEEISSKDEKQIDLQSTCILCQSCFSSCPVYQVNEDFLGPYALTRALRYVDDKKELDKKSILENIQKNGVWDCTLCGNCTIVCPQFIDPKTDIMNLRMKSVQEGYEDKSIIAYDSFDTGFDPMGGFNPNGF